MLWSRPASQEQEKEEEEQEEEEQQEGEEQEGETQEEEDSLCYPGCLYPHSGDPVHGSLQAHILFLNTRLDGCRLIVSGQIV